MVTSYKGHKERKQLASVEKVASNMVQLGMLFVPSGLLLRFRARKAQKQAHCEQMRHTNERMCAT